MRGTERRRWVERVSQHKLAGPGLEADDDEIGSDPLSAFSAEQSGGDLFRPRTAAAVHSVVEPRPRRWAAIVAGAMAALVAMVLVWAWPNVWSRRVAPPALGKLTLETRPPQAQVTIDGIVRGTTPLTVSLTAGAHAVNVRHRTAERDFPLNVAAGAEIAHYVELAAAPAAPAAGGRISVVTDPPGARVFIDDRARGVSPLTVGDLRAADHKVAVTSATGAAERIVSVEGNATASVFFSLPRVAAPLAGWLALTAPFEVQVIDGDRVLAIGRSATLPLTSGDHIITLVNDGLRYRETRRINVNGGQTTALRIDPPKAVFSANANPWAEVIIDGTNIGQTPIANVLVPIGEHEVVFDHPELGQRRRTMIVTMKGTNRIAVDFTQ